MSKRMIICIGPQVSDLTVQMLTGLLSGMEGITLVEETVPAPAGQQAAPYEIVRVADQCTPPAILVEDKRPYWRKLEKRNRS